MGNLSNIGFNVKNDRGLNKFIHKTMLKSQLIKTNKGDYFHYHDNSGAEIWLQVKNDDLIGFNPHYNGKSRQTVLLTELIKREDGSSMNGAYHCWVNPSEMFEPEPGRFPIVFDVPNYCESEIAKLPRKVTIQLSAFTQSIEMFSSEIEYDNNKRFNPGFASKSFIPSGLFSLNGEKCSRSEGIFTGFIKEFEVKINSLTNRPFYWLLLDTLDCEIDVVIDKKLIVKKPIINGIVQGQFWLSGKIMH